MQHTGCEAGLLMLGTASSKTCTMNMIHGQGLVHSHVAHLPEPSLPKVPKPMVSSPSMYSSSAWLKFILRDTHATQDMTCNHDSGCLMMDGLLKQIHAVTQLCQSINPRRSQHATCIDAQYAHTPGSVIAPAGLSAHLLAALRMSVRP